MLGTFQNWMLILERTLAASGHDLRQALAEAGVELPPLEPGARLPVELTRRIWTVAGQKVDDPALGLLMLQQVNFTDFGELGLVMLAGGSLPEVMDRIARFHRLLTDTMYYEISEDGDALCVAIHTRGDPHWRAVEFALGLILGLLRQRLQPPPDPLSVSLAFDNPAAQEAYEQYFACPVEQGAAVTTMVLPLSAYRVAPAGAEVARHFEPVLEQRLASLESAAGWAPKVADEVRRHLAATESEPTLAGVAAHLNVSPRSLQRHLAAEGKTFQDVLDAVRRELARQWLAQMSTGGRIRSLTELALVLGFSSSSAFSRAFRRWFGVTPGQAVRDGLEL
ncbi:MAG: AraC family transcriptional regulator ligand-binding domain-containing protein [Moraxellaceae bacterium]|nr:AraC family transcriptional regulator ligand-binding domain-containing protein [Moraxellaceae bacterium]